RIVPAPGIGSQAGVGSVPLPATTLRAKRPLRQVAVEAGIPYRTAQRWLTRYQQFVLAALARKRRVDKGGRRAVSAGIEAAIEGLALQKPPLPISALYRQVTTGSPRPWREGPVLWGRLRYRAEAAQRIY